MQDHRAVKTVTCAKMQGLTRVSMKTKVFSYCVKNKIKNWFRRGYLVYHDEVIHYTTGSVGNIRTVC